MLVTKTNPVGIDLYIQKLQTTLHTALLNKWEIASAQYMAYGRCYRNKTDDGYVAETYLGGISYKDVYWDSALSVLSFFGIGNTIRRNVKDEADVHLVFFADMKKLKPAIAHRADEEVRKDVTSLFGMNLKGFTLESTELSVDNVLREYPGSRRDNRLKFLDMHPVHCFRLNLKLIYDPNKIC